MSRARPWLTVGAVVEWHPKPVPGARRSPRRVHRVRVVRVLHAVVTVELETGRTEYASVYTLTPAGA